VLLQVQVWKTNPIQQGLKLEDTGCRVNETIQSERLIQYNKDWNIG